MTFYSLEKDADGNFYTVARQGFSEQKEADACIGRYMAEIANRVEQIRQLNEEIKVIKSQPIGEAVKAADVVAAAEAVEVKA